MAVNILTDPTTGNPLLDSSGNLLQSEIATGELQYKSVTANGLVTPDANYIGLSSVSVNVPTASGSISITSNGTYDVTEKASAVVNVPTGTARSSSDITVSGATVSVPAGLYSSAASKSVASGSATTPATTKQQSVPSISVSSSGLITTTVAATSVSITPTVSAGYVSSGTAGTVTMSANSNTKQLTTQAAKTVTPTTSSQTAVASGVYTTGAVTVNGDSNLVASNIKKDVSIFGVTGTYTGSSTWPPSTITAGDTPAIIVAGAHPSTSTSLTEVARITITKAGTYRFKWVAYRTSSTGTFQSQLWKNGVAVSSSYSPSTTTGYGVYSEDVSCSVNDYVCIYARGRSSSYSIIVSGFSACINGDNGF